MMALPVTVRGLVMRMPVTVFMRVRVAVASGQNASS
jgi:hypothetical protein